MRVARPSDAPAVGFVQAVLWRDAYARLLPPQAVESFQPAAFANAWRASLEKPPSAAYRLLVACAGEQVVGFAAVGPSTDPDAQESDGELLVLGVHPEARRVGHGSRLVNAAVDTARGAGFTTLRALAARRRRGDPRIPRRRRARSRRRLPRPGGGAADEDTAREVRVSGGIG